MHSSADLNRAFPACRAAMNSSQWASLTAEWEQRGRPEFSELVSACETGRTKPWLVELARLEAVLGGVRGRASLVPVEIDKQQINPTVELVSVAYAGLTRMLSGRNGEPEPKEELLLVWYDPGRRVARAAPADDILLLALKMSVEGVDPAAAGDDPEIPKRAVNRAAELGVILRPASRIRREPGFCDRVPTSLEKHLAAEVFTVQFHITQACDLRCKHCYDRSERSRMSMDQGLSVLDDLAAFCADRRVQGQVTFTGGNPLMHPRLPDLYREAANRGFRIALLANPTSRERIEELIAIKRPEYYQVSLEGLEEHNDYIRGDGHFRRTLDFLRVLKDLDIFSMVMLTLTRDNRYEVLPLAEEIKGLTDRFTFNRLSAVGEGASLALADTAGFKDFLAEYLDAAQGNPCMGLKDSLFNIVRRERKEGCFGGCAGFGCGAAFNFVSVLPDGEVHACRKFPSKIGNIFEQGLTGIYDSEEARRYRRGSKACNSCEIKPICGGCLAVASSMGLDPFTERDPYCFAPASGL